MTMKDVIHTLSLGAGVQSSTLGFLAKHGELRRRLKLPMPVAAIFADTKAEPRKVYDWLEWMRTQLPFPIIVVSRGDLAKDSVRLRRSKKSGRTYLSPSLPVFTVTAKGDDKDAPKVELGMLMRQCTRDYKIDVVRRATKELMRRYGASKCVQWIGISTDEALRMKPSRDPVIENIWPLIEMGMSREDCLAWMQTQKYPRPPRSACVFCPYHSDAEWLRLKMEEPEEFALAVRYESKLRRSVKTSTALKCDDAFLHASRQPLSKVEFKPTEDRKKGDQFNNECEGMCGV